jgi:putative NADH-flavin reductase
MRIVVFGANGGTGRTLTQQAIDADHAVVAVTRKPQEFPLSHERLTVAEADVHDRLATAEAIAGANVVLSALGVPFTRKPITIYSDGTASIAAAMERHSASSDTPPSLCRAGAPPASTARTFTPAAA